ncbi:MAG: hypothetical protein PHY48_13080 [Candidatus Cloacimonetes bacterium]|nr:hypothetical protein [Candidatus Cloacimonadota bacterium]
MKIKAIYIILVEMFFHLFFGGLAMGNQYEELKKTNAVVKSNEIKTLLDEIRKNHWKCPDIKSSSSIKRTLDPDKKNTEELSRQIGLAIAKIIEKSSKEIIISTDSVAVREETLKLITLSKWLAASPNYGNLLLICRCHDVASIGLAKLIVDESIPLTEIKEELLENINFEVYSAKNRAEILNFELGVYLFDVSNKSAEEVQLLLENTWGVGRSLHRRKRKEGNLPTIVVPAEIDIAKIENHVDLFADNNYKKREATSSLVDTWDDFDPELLVAGVLPKNIALVQALYTFREKVGGFPQVNFEDKEAAKELFDSAWRSNWTIDSSRDYRTIYSRAWLAYCKVKENNFVDEDTFRSRLRQRIN